MYIYIYSASPLSPLPAKGRDWRCAGSPSTANLVKGAWHPKWCQITIALRYTTGGFIDVISVIST